MLELPAAVHHEVLAHAIKGLPNEACGLLIGRFGATRAERFAALRNVAASSQVYEIDPADWAREEDAADREGLAILGVVHSHTHTSPYPSPTDVTQAGRADPFGVLRYVIVSLKFPEPAIRSFTIVDGEVTEEPIEID